MAIIYTYGFDDNVQDNDAWVGTNSGNRKTKQFSALSVANYMNRYARVSIGGQMSYKLTSSSPGLGEMTVIGGGDGTNFVDIEFLNISTSDLSGAQVVEFLDYLVSTGLLISHQNNPSTFGHYTVVAYTPTVDPSVYKLELGILGGNGKIFLNNYYDLSPLNLAGGTGSGVTTVDTSEGSFITLTPTTPTAGNVLITADLSATGTPDATTFLRGDNTWAVAGEVDGSGTTNYVSKWQDPTTLTDSVIYDNGTNVGIGTTSPAAKLTIGDGTAVDRTRTYYNDGTYTDVLGYGIEFNRGTSYLRPTGDNTQTLYIGSGANTWQNLNITAETTRFTTEANGESMRITSTGNVGIGTTSPSALLDVEGRVDIASDIRLRGQSTSINIGVVRLYVDATNNLFIDPGNAGTALSTFKSTGAVQLGNYGSGTFTGTATQRLAVDSSGNVIEIPIGSGPVDGSGTANYVTKWSDADTITDSVIYDNGTNVGIGTTSPIYALDVVGSLDNVARITSTNATSQILLVNSGTTDAIALSSTNDNFAIRVDNGRIDLKTNSGATALTRMRITSTGNVGIGTTSPSEKLHISSGYALVENTGVGSSIIINRTDGKALNLKAGAGSGQFTFDNTGFFAISSDTKTNILSGAGSGNQVFVVTGSGNVGIGTTSPQEKLDISAGNIRLDDSRQITWATTDANIGRVRITGSEAADNIIFFTDNSERMRLTNTGLGIGTASPSQKLHVSGNARLTGAFYDSNNSAGTIGQVLTSTSTSTEWTDPGSITQVPVPITAFAGGSLALAATVNFVYFSWLGGSGVYTLNLPSAVAYPYKVIRFVTDGGTSANNKIHIQGSGGQTVDGGVFYALDKAYNGVQVWSDGSEWIVIQAKAT